MNIKIIDDGIARSGPYICSCTFFFLPSTLERWMHFHIRIGRMPIRYIKMHNHMCSHANSSLARCNPYIFIMALYYMNRYNKLLHWMLDFMLKSSITNTNYNNNNGNNTKQVHSSACFSFSPSLKLSANFAGNHYLLQLRLQLPTRIFIYVNVRPIAIIIISIIVITLIIIVIISYVL